MSKNKHSIRRRFFHFIRVRFNLHTDKVPQEEFARRISERVDFGGANLWILVLAVLIASIGLDISTTTVTDSTVIIIGAMLISPLMGPVMGFGFSLGTNDYELARRSLVNIALIFGISIITSTLYFLFSPLSSIQNELLTRTTPTTWDLLIAFSGGMVGAIAISRKDKALNVIQGVAIATILIPPLCSAGYGIASFQFKYFIGSVYLFFINSVLISLATYIMVVILRYQKREFEDKIKERKVRNYILTAIIITVVPSLILGYHIVQKTIFETNATRFVNDMFLFNKTKVIDTKYAYSRDSSLIEIVLIGEPLPSDVISTIKNQMPIYKLGEASLNIKQNVEISDNIFNSQTIDKLYNVSSRLLEEKDQKIKDLSSVISKYNRDTLPSVDIAKEFSAISGMNTSVAMAKTFIYNHKGEVVDTVLLCVVKSGVDNGGKQRKLSDEETRQIIDWLKVRTDTNNIKLVVE